MTKTYVLNRSDYQAAINAAVELEKLGYKADVKITTTGVLLETSAGVVEVRDALK